MAARGWILAACAAAALDCAFLAPALFTNAVRAPGDIQVPYAVFREDPAAPPPPEPKNPVLADWVQVYHPWQHFVRDAYAAGRLPLWNDKSGCGQPLAANMQCEVFSPYVPLTLALGDQSVDWRQLAQMLVAQIGCLLLAARLRLTPAAGFLVAVVYSFSSFMQMWAVHTLAPSASFAPLLAWALIGAVTAPSAWRIALSAAFVAASVLAGHIETAAKVGLVAGVLAVCAPVPGPFLKTRLRSALVVAAAGLAGLLLAGLLLIPFLDYLSQSGMAEMRRELGAMWPDRRLKIRHLLTLLHPDALGPPHAFRGVFNYVEGVVFVGRIGLLLAAVGALSGLARRRRFTLPLIGLAVFGVFGAFGPVAFIEAWRAIPGLGEIWTWRLTYLAMLPAAVLAGLGLDALIGRVAAPRRALTAAAVCGAAAVELAVTWYGFVPQVPAATLHPPSRVLAEVRDRAPEGRTLDLGALMPAGLGEMYGVPRLHHYDAIGLRRYWDFALPRGAFPYFANAQQVTFAPPAVLDALSARWVLAPYPASEARVPADPILIEPGPGVTLDHTEVKARLEGAEIVVYRSGGASLRDGTVVIHAHHDGGDTTWTLHPDGWTALGGAPPEVSHGPAVQAFLDTQIGPEASVIRLPENIRATLHWMTFRVNAGTRPFRATILHKGGVGTSVREVGPIAGLILSERTRALPWAYFTPAIVAVGGREEAAGRVLGPAFAPHEATVVELPAALGPGVAGAPLLPEEHIEITRREPGLIAMNVRAAVPRVLVVTDAYARGWVATVDGAETPAFPANLVVKACVVPAGEHEVVMRYDPPAVTFGIITSGATLLGLLIAIAVNAFSASGRSRTTPRA